MSWPWNQKIISLAWRWPHIFWLNIFGCWAEEASTKIMQRWLAIYRVFTLIYSNITISRMMIAVGMRCVQGNILDNMFTIFGSCPGILGMFKLYSFIIFRKPLKSAMDIIDELLLDVRDDVEEREIRKTLKRSWIIFSVYLTISSCISMHWVCRPVINAILYGEKTLIVDTWPAFIDTWPQFFISFCFQLPFIMGVGHMFYFYDNIYFCISEFILCHFTILKYRLNKLKLVENKNVSSEIVECIKYHDKLLRACRFLRDSSSAVIIFQCIITVTILCSGVFIVTMSEHSDVNVLMNLGEEVIIVTLVLYLYCWYSNEMTFQCEDLCNAAYMSDWIAGTEENKKTLGILMTITNKPVFFGGILTINLQTFISVLKATFSYYNFLIACVSEQ